MERDGSSIPPATNGRIFAGSVPPPGDRIAPGPGQESVWDYPRPPRVEPVPERIWVVVDGVAIADSTQALRVLETAGPPVYYVPPADVRMDLLAQTSHRSVCEFKGEASYSPRLLRVGRGRGLGRPRACDAAAGAVLRGLGYVADRRPIQGRTGQLRLVGPPIPREIDRRGTGRLRCIAIPRSYGGRKRG